MFVADENIESAIVRQLRTGDTDFGELVFRQRRADAGVLVVRLVGLAPARKAAIVAAAVAAPGGAAGGVHGELARPGPHPSVVGFAIVARSIASGSSSG